MVAKTFGAESALEAETFPETLRVEPVPVTLIPTDPNGPNMDAVLSSGVLALVVAKTFGAESALEAVTFPETLSVEPVPVMLIPTDPNGPKMDAVLSLKALALMVAKTLRVARVLEMNTLPETFRIAPPPAQLIPTKPVVETI